MVARESNARLLNMQSQQCVSYEYFRVALTTACKPACLLAKVKCLTMSLYKVCIVFVSRPKVQSVYNA